MNAIGGYFGLELRNGEEYHKNAIRLNSGRNALELILKIKKYNKLFIPCFTCDVILEPIKKLNLDYEFYNIDEKLEPSFNYALLKDDEGFLYTNYFGLKNRFISILSKFCKNLIIDNAQAIYSKPVEGIDTFYSPRKFFGVPDGGYLYTDNQTGVDFEQDISLSRFEHLIGRIDLDAENFFELFKKNDALLEGQPIKTMSKITHRLLESIDYNDIAKKRRDNFKYLDSGLKGSNMLKFDIDEETVPMVYPYFIDNGTGIRKNLIENKIYVATYWPNVKDWAQPGNFEYRLASNLIPLPVDQRYRKTDMDYILSKILNS